MKAVAPRGLEAAMPIGRSLALRSTALLSLTLLCAAPASAHRPYAFKQKTVDSPQGPLTIEKLFGDGIFAADPVSMQVRNAQGAVLAYTSVSDHVALFCPSVSSCWAFPHDSVWGIPTPWRLDHADLDYAKTLDPKLALEQRGPVTYGFENPWGRKEASGFKKERSLMILAGPLIAFLDHGGLLGVLAVFCALPFALKTVLAKLALRQGPLNTALKVLVTLLYAFNAVVLILLFYVILARAAPWLYAAAVAGLSRWAGRRYLGSNQDDNPAILKPC